jgi:hypothetical protein
VLGGLVGRSEEWVKAVETDRLLTPRLPMLLRLADVLGITDLAQLTGDQSIPVASISKGIHAAAGDVGTAMINAIRTPAAEDPSLSALTARVDQAWTLWHHSDAHRTAVAIAGWWVDTVACGPTVWFALPFRCRHRRLADQLGLLGYARLKPGPLIPVGS